MSISAFLYPILAEAAGLIASSAAGEFAKSAGKEAYTQLKDRLVGTHKVNSVALLEQAKDNPDYEVLIKKELDAKALEQDTRIQALAEALLTAMQDLPPGLRPQVALEADVIRAKGKLLFRNVEGIKAGDIISDDDMTFDGITRGK